MKKYFSVLIAVFVSTCMLAVTNTQDYTCSGVFEDSVTGSATITLCAENYNPTQVGGEPTTWIVDLPAGHNYKISGWTSLEAVQYIDFIVIREIDASGNTIAYISTPNVPNHNHDIFSRVSSSRTGRFAIDIYCFIGATNAYDGFEFTISPLENTEMEQACISSFLGVGTCNPDKPLHIVGESKFSHPLYTNHYMLLQPTNDDISFISSIAHFRFNKIVYGNNGFVSPRNTNLTLKTDTFTRMTILNSNGYVGIGTNNPQEMLHVNGYIRGHAQNGEVIVRTNSGYTQIGASNSGYSHFFTDMPGFYFNVLLTVNGGKFRSASGQNLYLNTFSTTRMTILSSNGNVGIGNETPAYKLDVAGEIHSDSIQSDIIKAGAIFVQPLSGADYVFDETYNLRSLDDVKENIVENKHLPEIQSAEEMLENGISIDRFQIQLLQKIEELTLYIIRQEERIKELENKQK